MSAEGHAAPALAGLWFRVDARVRPLRPEERPALGPLDDDRMVTFAEQAPGGMLRPSWRGLYDPQETPALAADFMRLFAGSVRPRAAHLTAFHAAYGPLRERAVTDGEEVPAWAVRLPLEGRASLSREARLLLCEPVFWLRRRAREVRHTYELYLALRADDLGSLRALLPQVPEGMRLDRLAIEDGAIIPYVAQQEPRRPRQRRAGSAAVEQRLDDVSPERPRRPLTDEECRLWGRRLLAQQLTWGERRAELRWHLEDPSERDGARSAVASGVPGLVRARAFPDLLTAIYVQLGDLVSANQLYQVCPGCGGPFHQADRRQKYCHPRCGDAARQRLIYRQPGRTGRRTGRGKGRSR